MKVIHFISGETLGMQDREIQNHFWRPLSVEASAQMVELQDLLNEIQTNPNEADKWSYIWNSDDFSSKKHTFKSLVLMMLHPSLNGCESPVL
jgi:hypothetical protein